ncbi:MAG: hypothetical protein JSR76_07700 [Verrucomicrobia bacterium]|nr:hypothetical protein [Verrucomicrobiota bacterium]
MKLIFYSVMLFTALGVSASENEVALPGNDGRFARAAFVSSLIPENAIGAEIGVCYGVFAYHVLLKKILLLYI